MKELPIWAKPENWASCRPIMSLNALAIEFWPQEGKTFANRIYPLMGHDVIQKGFALKNLLPTACPCWAQRSISLQVSILYEISHLRSRWHCCHSERSVSREKNLSQTESTIAIIANKKRIPRRLIASLGMTRGYRPWNTHHLNSEKSLA